MNLKSYLVMIAVCLSSCGYNDDLHIRHHMLLLLWNKQYQELDINLNEQYALYKQGKLKGAEFSRQIAALEHANKGAESRFSGYVEAMPKSIWPHLLYGLYIVKQAEEVRGIRYASETPKENFDKMEAFANQARVLLETAHEHQAPFSLYAGGMIKVNKMLHTREENLSLVKEAMARDRDIWRASDAYFFTLFPQWGGSEVAMSDFVAEVKPKNPELANDLQALTYWRRGKNYHVNGQIELAINEYEQGAKFYPDDFLMKDLGELYLRTQQCEKAVDILEKNLEENDAWDLWTLESLTQAHDCAGNSWRAKRVNSKRSELFARYAKGE
jgi:tetratricopeptide (TPR) repeat protein